MATCIRATWCSLRMAYSLLDKIGISAFSELCDMHYNNNCFHRGFEWPTSTFHLPFLTKSFLFGIMRYLDLKSLCISSRVIFREQWTFFINNDLRQNPVDVYLIKHSWLELASYIYVGFHTYVCYITAFFSQSCLHVSRHQTFIVFSTNRSWPSNSPKLSTNLEDITNIGPK